VIYKLLRLGFGHVFIARYLLHKYASASERAAKKNNSISAVDLLSPQSHLKVERIALLINDNCSSCLWSFTSFTKDLYTRACTVGES